LAEKFIGYPEIIPIDVQSNVEAFQYEVIYDNPTTYYRD